MDSLKLIPQVFFDLIGRVVPGAVAIIAALLLARETWESSLNATLGKTLATSSTASVLMFVGCAYVTGQLFSPLAKLIQRAGEFKYIKYIKPESSLDKFLQGIRAMKYLQPGPDSKEEYDWLRTNHAKAGAFCAKIRAEFTMHNGLAAVLLVTAAAYPFSDQVWRWSVLVGLIIGGVVTAIRGRLTRDTFHKTVEKFAKAVREKQKNHDPHQITAA